MDEDEGVNDIFDDDLDNMVENDGDINEETGEINAGIANNEQDDSTQTARRVEVKKRVVRNPRVTLNAERLCGERGIATLPKAFENITFKGRGHEKEDLDKLMSVLKHWCYYLFPSLCFNDVLETIERLGKKKQVQVCMKKIRMDMPVLSEDFVREDSDDDNNNQNLFNAAEISQDVDNNHNDPLGVPGTSSTMLSEEAFDELIKEQEQYMDLPVMHGIENLSADNFLLNSFPARSSAASPELVESLSEEQKEQIERSARLARERRTQSKFIQPVDGHIGGNDLDMKMAFVLDSPLNATNSNTVPNIPLMESFEELELRNHSGLEVMISAKESELSEYHNIDSELPLPAKTFNLNDSCSETLPYVKESDIIKSHDDEVMFSSDESNDEIKLNIAADAFLKCGEHSELAEGSKGIIE